MQIIKPNTISPTDGTFTRASSGTYFDATGTIQTALTNQPRFNYNKFTGLFEGLLIESAATNLLLNSATLSTQNVTVSNVPYTLSFYGTGTITRSGTSTGALVGAAGVRSTVTFTPTAGTLTLTVTGTVSNAQLETGIKATSWITTTGSTATRAADVITGSGLIYSTATDATAAYNSGTTYAITNKVRYANKIWESLQSSNTNHQPDISPLWWLDLGADNIHAALDASVSTATSATAALTFVVKPGEFDALALINLDSSVLEVAVRDATTGDLLFNNSSGLSGDNVLDWYQYFFFSTLVKRTQLVFTSLLSGYPNAVATIRLLGGISDIVKIGHVVFGILEQLGGTQYGANAGITDYSRKETDEFGGVTLIERPFSKRLSAEVFVANTQLNRVQSTLYSIRAKPVVWIGSLDPQFEETLIIWGFYKDFSTNIAYPSHSLCSLEIEGLT